MKYTKYKTRAKLVLTGDDDMFGNNTGSTYKTTGSSYINGKTIRFNLNGAFNDVKYQKIPVVLWKLVTCLQLQE